MNLKTEIAQMPENLVAQLEKAGLVKRKTPEGSAPASGEGGAAAAGSPNFQ